MIAHDYWVLFQKTGLPLFYLLFKMKQETEDKAKSV